MTADSIAKRAPAGRTNIPHLPALDGLRGLAVLAVLFFHDGHLAGGYLGVDLFFVLSGFLITSILLAEHRATATVDLRAFWIRRARRLFPALLSLMPAIALYARVWADPADRGRLRGDALATLGYVANWRAVIAKQSYWELFAKPSPLEHTWSLAIEEQFYLGWPLLVLAVCAGFRRSRLVLGVACVALAIASAVTMTALFGAGATNHAYFGTDARGAAILVGAALAALLAPLAPASDSSLTRTRARVFDILGVASAVGLGVAWFRLDGQEPFLYRGGFWLTECAALVLIACAVEGRASLVARALSARPLAAVGIVSYGVYLWHWPIFIVLDEARTHLAGAPLSALRFAATFAVALVSYQFLEQPIRRHGVRGARFVVPLALASAVAIVLVAARPAPPPPIAIAPPVPPPPPIDLRDLPPASALPPGTTRVLVLGDSVAVALGERMRFVSPSLPDGAHVFVGDRGLGNCSLLEGVVPTRSLNGPSHEGGNCAARWEEDAAELLPDVTLVVLGGGFFARAEIDGTWQTACDRRFHERYRRELVGRLEGLEAHGGRRVVARIPYPVGSWKSPSVDERVDCFQKTLDEAIASVDGVLTLDLRTKLCPEGVCQLLDSGAPVRPDGMHFDGLGAEEIARWTLHELLARSTRPTR